MAIRISACVITKNEDQNIGSWLRCMSAIADEMIVVDTGSKDKTVAMAEAAGAKVYSFKWINDFAAAKNYALDRATGDWILFLDADEYFTDSSQRKLKVELKRFDKDKNTACLLCRLINIDKDNGNRVINTSLLPRIFRNSPNIRYKGAIHEQLENRCGNKKMIFASELEIYHTGYSESIVKAKSLRNLPLMLEELGAAKTDAERNRLYPYLADAYNSLGDYENTIKYAKICIDNNLKMVGAEGKFYGLIILAMYNTGYKTEETLQVIDEAERAYPREPFFEFCRGLVLYSANNYLEAELAFIRGLDLRSEVEKRMQQGEGASNTSQGLLRHIYEKLGSIYELKGDMEKAADNYMLALQESRYQTGALEGLCRAIKDGNPVDIIQLLNSWYDKNTDAAYLLRALKKYMRGPVCAYYAKYAETIKLSDLFVTAGRFDAASAELGYKAELLCLAGALAKSGEKSELAYANVLMPIKYKKYLLGSQSSEADNKHILEVLKRINSYRLENGYEN